MDEKLVIIKKEGKKALEVTERLYHVYYKGLGYKSVESEESEPVDNNNQEPDGTDGGQDNGEGPDVDTDGFDNVLDEGEAEDLPHYNDITKAEIIEQLKQGNIEHNPRDSKEVLYALLEGE
ncbi:hypothetical protein [Exiguobacterium sp. s155]|uniref:hypothetical protein n=1 Tax=Exiguobacterium sp. s155 TaxID=2751286 RepID=UPI001BE614CB|nr:hypothetical protein [Exiguobacterium sp. s155]